MSLIGSPILLQILGVANRLFEQCTHNYELQPYTQLILQSPYNPQRYPSGTSCRYSFIAPQDFEIAVECRIELDKAASACSTEYFYVSTEGDPNLNGADQFCGSGSFTRTSLFRNLVMAYVSGASASSGVAGRFSCKLTTRPQACDCGWSRTTRIVGGTETGIGEFPSMVGLYHVPSQTVFCGGTILNHRTIATAAHCTRLHPNPSEILIVAGDHDLSSSTESQYAKTYNVYKYVEHPSYNPSTDVNDIALLITTGDIDWSRGVGPICLPLDQTNNAFVNTYVDVVGWGTTSFSGSRSTTLQKAQVNVIANSACQTIYNSLASTQMCTYYPNRDACQFDSGGPAVYKGSIREYLLAIISYGYACGSNPGVNTRVTSYLSWIQNNAAGSFCYKPFS